MTSLDSNGNSSPLQPFLKWTGGKRALANSIVDHFPKKYGSYLEPFLGSGAVFFDLMPQSAILSDLNPDLINLYKMVKSNVEALINRLNQMSISKEEFYRIRAEIPNSDLERAARILYLNKTAFNGIYRVNRMGQFNVPYGCKPNTQLCEPQKLRLAARALRNKDLSAGDFSSTIRKSKEGDILYADPPYTVKHDRNGFRRYNNRFFDWEDQQRLASEIRKAERRGVHIVISNAFHEDIRNLYPRFGRIILRRTSCISGRSKGRGPVKEYLLISPSLLSTLRQERDAQGEL